MFIFNIFNIQIFCIFKFYKLLEISGMNSWINYLDTQVQIAKFKVKETASKAVKEPISALINREGGVT